MSLVGILDLFFGKKSHVAFKKHLRNFLGFAPGKIALYKAALTHRSVRDTADENNERLEYLGDAILSAIVADFLFKKYPYKEEGFLTEMRSKMVNRNKLNEIALKMGVKKITNFNKFDNSLKMSQIFGNTLEALVGAVYLDQGFKSTQLWVLKQIIIPHLYMEDLENLEFETLDERMEGGRRLFTIGAVVKGQLIAEAKAYNKKDASQVAAALALDKLGLNNIPETGDSHAR